MTDALRFPGFALADPFGRVIDYLRMSITDRCNLRCQYCMPASGMRFIERRRVLSADDFVWVGAVVSLVGVRHLRVTGGEPLTRPDAAEIVARLKGTKGISSVAMTSNGLLLAKHARALAEAKLDRLNVSIDSLRPERFSEMTRGGDLSQVWEGLRAAAAVGLSVKVNAVVLSGWNADEVDGWVEVARELDLTVRFLELMPVGGGRSAVEAGELSRPGANADRLMRALWVAIAGGRRARGDRAGGRWAWASALLGAARGEGALGLYHADVS